MVNDRPHNKTTSALFIQVTIHIQLCLCRSNKHLSFFQVFLFVLEMQKDKVCALIHFHLSHRSCFFVDISFFLDDKGSLKEEIRFLNNLKSPQLTVSDVAGGEVFYTSYFPLSVRVDLFIICMVTECSMIFTANNFQRR